MSHFINYTFTGINVANPDGSLQTTLPADATIGDGPGDFHGQSLPGAARLGNSSAIQIDIQTVNIINESRFNVSVAFNLDNNFSGRQVLAESERLPFILELDGMGASVKLIASVKTMSWHGTDSYSSPSVGPGQWHFAQLVYDMDTLFVFLDGSPVGCHGFGANGNISISEATKTVIVGGKDAENRFRGQLAAFRLGFGVPIEIEPLMDNQRFSPQWFITTKLETSRSMVDMGVATSNTVFDTNTTMWSQDYSVGTIMYHSAASSAFILYGFICHRYVQLPEATKAALGYLASDEMSAYAQGARKSLFQGGGIYWSSATGAFEVTGQLYLHYEATGESRDWGLPVEPAQEIAGGLSQRMQEATLFYKYNLASAHLVQGAILDAYLRTGGPAKWGFPLSDELVVKGVKDGTVERNVRLSQFQQCDIYWSTKTGAHSTYGDIRLKWASLGGTSSELGLPVTDEMDIPGGGRTNGYENGVVVWYGNFDSMKIIQPFKIFVGNLNTIESEGWLMGQNDLYFMATINDGNYTAFRQRYPSSDSWDGRNTIDVNIEFPAVLTPNPTKEITLVVDVWESDGGAPFGGGDDHLGTWTKPLSSGNAWGLLENGGILNSGHFAYINNISAAVHPQVNINALTEVEKFWGAGAWNRGNDPIDYQTYAEAFRDVDSSPEAYDPLDWLDKAFYEAVTKHLCKGGNCFGMSLEAIYARKGLSLFSLPINRFDSWDQLQQSFNVKHQYQVGAGEIWWFVDQCLSGNTHSPVSVFSESHDAFDHGDNPILCLSQNADFSGAPHAVMPVAWDSSANPWKISIHDPNFPDQVRTITIDSGANTWRYDGTSSYAGDEWSGGRLHYMPWSLLNTAPRTPVWDAILLILAGTVIIMGSDTETASITAADGGDLSAHSPRAVRALQGGRKLEGYFVNTPIMMGDGFPGELKVTRGSQGPTPHILPMRPDRSAISRFVGTSPAIDLTPHTPLTALETRLSPFLPTNNFLHTIRGKQGGGMHRQLVKSGTTQFVISAPINEGETAQIQAKALGTVNSEISLTHSRGKDHEIALMQRLGMSRDSVSMKFNLTSTAPGTIQLSPKPGMGLIEINSSAAQLRVAKLEVATMSNGTVLTHYFDMVRPGEDVLEGHLRLKVPVGLRRPTVTITAMDGAGMGSVVGSRLVQGERVGGILSGLGHLGGLGHLTEIDIGT
jgi:hypothetical protein